MRDKLAAAFESMTFPGGNPLSCADEDYNTPYWGSFSVDPYEYWRAYQYTHNYESYVKQGFGVLEDCIHGWFTGGDGSGDEPTQEKL